MLMRKKTPKITVYMPNYNYGRFIEQAIESVKNQVFKDWELIVIDDGSTDGSSSILERYSTDERITVVYQENEGLNTTNNVAIRLSRGKYIVRLDADDFLDESFLLVLAAVLDEKRDVGLVFADYHHVDTDGNILETVRREKTQNDNGLLDLPAHGACTMFRKDILINLGSYDEEFNCQDGYDIWIRFIEKHKPYNLNAPLFYYRQHTSNLTKNSAKVLDTRRAIKRKFVKARKHLDMDVLGLLLVHQSSIYKQNGPFVLLNNKPLINYILEQVSKTDYLTNIAVSSFDQNVLNYVEEHFPEVLCLTRREDLKAFNISNAAIVNDALQKAEEITKHKYDALCLLSVSTPLLQAKHIDHAINTMQVFGVDSVRSVQEEFSPCYHHENDGLQGINVMDNNRPRLERKAIYKDNGALLLMRTENIKDGDANGKRVGHITMLPEESIKINSDFEFWLAEQIILSWDN